MRDHRCLRAVFMPAESCCYLSFSMQKLQNSLAMAQLPERGLQGEDCLGMWLYKAIFLVEQVLMLLSQILTLLPSSATPVPVLQFGSDLCDHSWGSSATRGPPAPAPSHHVSSLHPPGAYSLAVPSQQLQQEETWMDEQGLPIPLTLPFPGKRMWAGKYSK